jgi:hypothetical protein
LEISTQKPKFIKIGNFSSKIQACQKLQISAQKIQAYQNCKISTQKTQIVIALKDPKPT